MDIPSATIFEEVSAVHITGRFDWANMSLDDKWQQNADAGESRIDRVKKLLSSPLTRRKSACNPSTGSSSSSKIFGNPLAVLAQQDHPPCTRSSSVAKQPYIPYVMSRLCDFIESNSGMTQEGLFRVSGNAKLVDKLRNTFDTSGDAPLETDGDVPSAAALLKLFLRELPEPVIPLHAHPLFLEAAKDFVDNKEACVFHLKNLVNSLPDENYYILKYLSNFLNRVSRHESHNRMNSSSLGIVFGPNLFRVSADDYEGLREQALTNQTVSASISDYRYIFEESSLGNRISRPLLAASKPLEPLSVEIPVTKIAVNFKKVNENKHQKQLQSPQLHSDVILLLTINNEEVGGTLAKGKKRKECRLSGLDTTGQSRSSSKKRPSPDMSAIDIRRCNSTEEMSYESIHKTFTSLSEDNLLDVSPHPTFAKRRHQLDEQSGEEAEVGTPSPSLSETCHDNAEARKTDERNAPVRRPPVQRAKRLTDFKKVNIHVNEVQTETSNDPVVDNSLVQVNVIESNISQPPCVSESMDNESVMRDESIRPSDKKPDCSVATDKEKECTQPLEVDTLHLNALTSEPIVSEQHRYSWPFIHDKQDDDDKSTENQTATYPLIQHATLHSLKNKSKSSNEAPVSPSAFRSFLHQRTKLDPSVPPSPPVEQERTYPDNKAIRETPAVKDVKKKIHALKRKLKEFETEFELKHGYKPSHGQKMNSLIAKPIITELNSLRIELKDIRDDITFSEYDLGNNSSKLWSFHEKIDISYSQATDEIENALRIARSGDKRLDDALHKMLETLEIKRSLVERPCQLETMNDDQIMDEKLDLQKTLLKFESIYGRPDNRRDRDIMRPLYDRYRIVKRILAKIPNKPTKKESTDLQPILEHVAMSFNSSMQPERVSSEISLLDGDDDAVDQPDPNDNIEVQQVENQTSAANTDTSTSGVKKAPTTNLHELPFKELLKQLHC